MTPSLESNSYFLSTPDDTMTKIMQTNRTAVNKNTIGDEIFVLTFKCGQSSLEVPHP